MRQPTPRPLSGRITKLALTAALLAPNVVGAQAKAPDSSTYGAIDSALQGETLSELGSNWRYAPGLAEPSAELEWTLADFDDSGWSEGPSGFGLGDEEQATSLDGIEGTFTTLYLRQRLQVEDPARYRLVELRIPIDDAYIAYVNGKEAGRLGAGPPNIRMAFDKQATIARGLDVLPVPTANLTTHLVAGENLIAIQILQAPDETSLGARPSIRGSYRRNPEEHKARVKALRTQLEADGAEARLAYLEGRLLQRRRKHSEAAPHFLRAAGLDPAASAPLKRLTESRRKAGQLVELEAELRERVVSGVATTALFDAWSRVLLLDLGRPTTEILSVVNSEELPTEGFFADAVWGARELSEGRSLRIDCGATTRTATENDEGATLWSRDRFYTSGSRLEQESEDVLQRTARSFDGNMDAVTPTYRVPTPAGLYELVLHFEAAGPGAPAPGTQIVDVVIDGARALAKYDPIADPRAGGVRFPLRTSGGYFEFELSPYEALRPTLIAFEVHPLDADTFSQRAAQQVEETGRRSAFALVQLAEAQALAGDEGASLATLEAASELPAFRPADRERLNALRDARVRHVASFAVIDDLLARRPKEASALLGAIEGDADKAELATYLRGRIQQRGGGIDDAIVHFEELVAEGSSAAEPHLRMVECLRDAGLAPEADGILREALAVGVKPTREFLEFWISLNLDDLERDPWAVVNDLRETEHPSELVLVPTAEAAPRTWKYTPVEPPTTTWSRPTFNVSSWNTGPAGIGAGIAFGAPARSLWNTRVVFARQVFNAPGRKLLYPYVRVNADDAGEVYVNGTLVTRVDYRTDGYVMVPMRQGSVAPGENGLGLYGINLRGASYVDAGIVQPIGDLVWVADQLEENGAIRINCGGDDFVAADGTTWARDRFFGHGRVWKPKAGETIPDVVGTENVGLYKDQRWFLWLEGGGSAWYQVPVPNGSYRVTLHFAEIEPLIETEGQRVIDILLEKERVFEGHDVIKEVGHHTAFARTFETQVRDGWLDLDFNSQTGRAFLAGLEIAR